MGLSGEMDGPGPACPEGLSQQGGAPISRCWAWVTCELLQHLKSHKRMRKAQARMQKYGGLSHLTWSHLDILGLGRTSAGRWVWNQA